MELGDALKDIYSNLTINNNKYLLGCLLDRCSDTFENKDYAVLYYKINKEFDMYNIMKQNGVYKGVTELKNRYSKLGFKVSKEEYDYIIASLKYVFTGEKPKKRTENASNSTNDRNINNTNNKEGNAVNNGNNIKRRTQSTTVLINQSNNSINKTNNIISQFDICIKANDLQIIRDKNISYYPINRKLKLSNGILSGTLDNDFILNLVDDYITIGKIKSLSGDVYIDSIKAEMINIDILSGDVHIGRGVNVSILNVKSSSGNVFIDGAKIHKLRINTTSGNINVNSLLIDELMWGTTCGDINLFLRPSAKILSC